MTELSRAEQEFREEIALEVHKWHCPDEACVDEVYWTGPCMADYLECADPILALIKEAGYHLPAGKAPLLTDEQLLGIRAEIPGTTNVIEFAREVSRLTAKAQNDADNKHFGVKE